MLKQEKDQKADSRQCYDGKQDDQTPHHDVPIISSTHGKTPLFTNSHVHTPAQNARNLCTSVSDRILLPSPVLP